MIPDKLKEVISDEGVVAIATQGEKLPHLVNTWHSYLQVLEDGNSLVIPVGGMEKTEKNLQKNNSVLMTVGNKRVDGYNGPGTGFLIEGKAEFKRSGDEFKLIKDKFPWARAALKVTIKDTTQTL